MLFIAFYKDKKLNFYKVGGVVETFEPKNTKYKFKDKKILVIGDILYLKEQYPKTSEENLKAIIQNTLEDGFPDKELDFLYDFEEEGDSFSVNIYAFDKNILKEIREVFDYQYLLAEYMCFSSTEPTLIIFEDKTYKLIAFEKKTISVASLKDISKEGLNIFLKSLYPFTPKKIINYTNRDLNIENEIKLPPPKYPLFLNYINQVDLRRYKISPAISINPYFIYRVLFYIAFAYGMALYVNTSYYDHYLKSLKQVHKELSKALAKKLHQSKTPQKNLSKSFYKEYETTVLYQDPIFVFSTLSKLLTKDSYITNADMNPKDLKVNINTKDPFNIISNLTNSDCVKEFNLTSPIQKSFGNQFYMLNLEMVLCKR